MISKIPERRAQNAVKCTALVDESERQIIVTDSELDAIQMRDRMWMSTDHKVRVVDSINVDVFVRKLGYDLVGNVEVL